MAVKSLVALKSLRLSLQRWQGDKGGVLEEARKGDKQAVTKVFRQVIPCERVFGRQPNDCLPTVYLCKFKIVNNEVMEML